MECDDAKHVDLLSFVFSQLTISSGQVLKLSPIRHFKIGHQMYINLNEINLLGGSFCSIESENFQMNDLNALFLVGINPF